MDHRFRRGVTKYVVLAEASRPVEPCESAFDDPALGQCSKQMLLVAFYDFDGVAKHIFCPVDQFAGVAAIGKLIDWAKDMFGYSVEIVKRNEQHLFRVLPKRWIVEPTFAWLNWSRRLSKDYELRHTSAESMIHIAFAHMILRRSP